MPHQLVPQPHHPSQQSIDEAYEQMLEDQAMMEQQGGICGGGGGMMPDMSIVSPSEKEMCNIIRMDLA
jgi:hypothetical protein